MVLLTNDTKVIIITLNIIVTIFLLIILAFIRDFKSFNSLSHVSAIPTRLSSTALLFKRILIGPSSFIQSDHDRRLSDNLRVCLISK